jgi:ATP-binding cassette subfamily C protein CydC
MIRIWKLVLPEWKTMLAASLLAFLATGSSVGLLYCSGFVLTYAALQPSIAVISVPIVLLRAFGLSRGVFRYLDRMKSHDAALRILEHFRLWFYSRLEPLVPNGLRHFPQGELFQAMARDVDSLEYLYARVISPPLVALWTTILMIILVGKTSAILVGTYLIFQGLAILSVFILLPAIRRRSDQIRQLASELQELGLDLFHGHTQLKIAGTLDKWQTAFGDKELQHNRSVRKLSSMISAAEATIPFLSMAAAISMVWISAPWVLDGTLRPMEWVALLLSVLASFESVQAFPAMAHALQHSESAGKRLLKIADQGAPSLSPMLFAEQDEVVRLSNLGYRWPDGDFLFRNLNYSLLPGKTYALIGPSGGGKSTLANCLIHFLQPTEGTIVVQNQLQTAPATLLDQHPHFFTGTMAENLRIAKPDATDGEIQNVLKQVGFGTPDYWIGEQGTELSGGQRQRLAAARILLRKSRLVILDEPAAHLDASAEEDILKLFISEAKSKSFALLVITHRPQFLNLFDEIIEMPGN